MFGLHAYEFPSDNNPQCWYRMRDESRASQPPGIFFAGLMSGADCGSNWYDGLGPQPEFPEPAPALLGFDTSIDQLCRVYNRNGRVRQEKVPCVERNFNILALFGTTLPYNMCRNLEWLVCAAKGELVGQETPVLRFAEKPADLRIDANTGDGGRPLGKCGGYAEENRLLDGRSCVSGEGYNNDDVFFLEVCIYSVICDNADSLFTDAGPEEDWVCDFNPEGLRKLESWLTAEIDGKVPRWVTNSATGAVTG